MQPRQDPPATGQAPAARCGPKMLMSKDGNKGKNDPELWVRTDPELKRVRVPTQSSEHPQYSHQHVLGLKYTEGKEPHPCCDNPPSPPCDNPRGFVLKVAGKATPAEEQGQAALH